MASTGQALVGHLAEVTQVPLQQKIGWLISLAAIIAVLAGAWMWSSTPDYRALYGNLSDRDGGAVIAALNQMNVPYKFEGSGTIMVPADRVHDVRLRLAAQNLPRGGNPGFELMEKQAFGTTELAQQVTYQRALEGELARSIQTLSAVESARVHLAIPKPTVFMRATQKPTASVVLQLYSGRGLEPGQVNAIVNLVSASIPDMPARNVKVVDQAGTLLSDQQVAPGGLDPSQLKHVQSVESRMVAGIEKILEPVVGAGNARATVTAEIDFSQAESVEESYQPNGDQQKASVRSMRTSESMQQGASGPSGIPGAASNQPPQPATAPLTAPGAPQGQQQAAAKPAGPVSTNKESVSNYELNRTLTHTRPATWKVARLSAAVVVNHRTQAAADGKTSLVPLTDAEKEQITALVKDAIGFNDKRGDSVKVVNVPFSTPGAVAPEEPLPFWKRPDMIAMGKDALRHLLIAVVVLYLVLGVFRPMLRSYATVPVTPELLPAPADGELAVVGDGDGEEARQVSPYETNLASARQITRQDPKLVATMVKNWMNNDER